MYIKRVCNVIPLKNVGFQKKNGTRPHLTNRQNMKLKQTADKTKTCFVFEIATIQENIESNKNQSNVKNFK